MLGGSQLKLPELKIGELVAKIPIIQGGMGVGISLSSLAGAVAQSGGIGVISGVEIGFNEPDYFTNKMAANLRALRAHIRKAREIAGSGVLGINIMTALNNFEQMAVESIKEKIDIIFCGAGLPLKLPRLVGGSKTKIAPIVSSGRAASIICKSWDKNYGVAPDAIVVEGPLAGGHLGFDEEELENPACRLKNILNDVLEAVKSYEEKYKKKIPVVAGGGVYSGKDIAELLEMGASGVQMATRFVATHECDASPEFKKAYIDARKEDLTIIKSPVGMIGRAINNRFLEDAKAGLKKPIRCICNCLKSCDPTKSPYCIADALISAQKGNLKDGFAFAGANAYRVDKIVSVVELLRELVSEAEKYYREDAQ